MERGLAVDEVEMKNDCSDNLLQPFKLDQFITRAETIMMINRVLNRVPETKDDLRDNMIKWPDNSDESVWYYLPV